MDRSPSGKCVARRGRKGGRRKRWWWYYKDKEMSGFIMFPEGRWQGRYQEQCVYMNASYWQWIQFITLPIGKNHWQEAFSCIVHNLEDRALN